jgi:isopenicillin N synthase-like dioxygenase
VIDLKAGSWTTPPFDVVDEFAAACADLGFLVVEGHGVDEQIISKMLDIMKEFFHQSLETKRQYTSPSGNVFKGFCVGGRYKDGPRDQREGFQVGWFDDADSMVRSGYSDEFTHDVEPNIWPDQPEGFEKVVKRYFAAVRELGDRILEVAAAALGMEPEWFADKFTRQNSQLLANYYPAQHETPEGGSQRLHAHTDYGGFTILYQDSDKGGLEVLRRDGSWLRVPAIPGTFIVNLGDMLANWTNGRWVATMHRVRNSDPNEVGAERISIPFFQHPNLDAVIETVPTCLDADEKPKYEPVLWRDWGKKRMAEVGE